MNNRFSTLKAKIDLWYKNFSLIKPLSNFIRILTPKSVFLKKIIYSPLFLPVPGPENKVGPQNFVLGNGKNSVLGNRKGTWNGTHFFLGTGIMTYFFFLLILPLIVLFLLILQNNWNEIFRKATDPIAVSAYLLTVQMAFYAALINTVFGFLITWILIRYNFFGKSFLDASVDLPFALPTSVAGLTLATVYGDQGCIGSLFNFFGFQIVFTKFGILLAMIFVSFPFVIRTLQPVLQEVEQSLEEAAWSLGASSGQTFLKVILPTLWPALFTGFTLSFSRALGEFGSIIMISSNLPFKDLVASVLIYQSLEQYDYLGASVIGAVVLLIALLTLLMINAFQSMKFRV